MNVSGANGSVPTKLELTDAIACVPLGVNLEAGVCAYRQRARWDTGEPTFRPCGVEGACQAAPVVMRLLGRPIATEVIPTGDADGDKVARDRALARGAPGTPEIEMEEVDRAQERAQAWRAERHRRPRGTAAKETPMPKAREAPQDQDGDRFCSGSREKPRCPVKLRKSSVGDQCFRCRERDGLLKPLGALGGKGKPRRQHDDATEALIQAAADRRKRIVDAAPVVGRRAVPAATPAAAPAAPETRAPPPAAPTPAPAPPAAPAPVEDDDACPVGDPNCHDPDDGIHDHATCTAPAADYAGLEDDPGVIALRQDDDDVPCPMGDPDCGGPRTGNHERCTWAPATPRAEPSAAVPPSPSARPIAPMPPEERAFVQTPPLTPREALRLAVTWFEEHDETERPLYADLVNALTGIRGAAHDMAELGDVGGLSNEYLGACVREARRRRDLLSV